MQLRDFRYFSYISVACARNGELFKTAQVCTVEVAGRDETRRRSQA